jgi:hypothetical protein
MHLHYQSAHLADDRVLKIDNVDYLPYPEIGINVPPISRIQDEEQELDVLEEELGNDKPEGAKSCRPFLKGRHSWCH